MSSPLLILLYVSLLNIMLFSNNNVKATSSAHGFARGPTFGTESVILAILVLVLVISIVLCMWRNKRYFVAYRPRRSSESRRIRDYYEAPRLDVFPTQLYPLEGDRVRIEGEIEGHPPPRLVWYHNGKHIGNDDKSSLLFPRIDFKHSGVYKLVASNVCGEAEIVVIVTVMSNGDDEFENSGIEETSTYTRIPVEKFEDYVSVHLSDGNKKFKESFEKLPSREEGHKITVSTTASNNFRHRFENIRAYDNDRVVLQLLSSGDVKYENDYINASYIDGYSVKNKFIATQGPLPRTIIDFWRMVWQERPSAIVMLTNCEEGGRTTCEQYWPEEKQIYGPFEVVTTNQSRRLDYTVRNFEIKSLERQSFKLTQFHFTAWPDHGVPAYASPVLSFLRLIRSHYVPSSGPLIVHCSSGVGRTSIYITLDKVLDQIKAKNIVDIDGVVVKMREQRMKMVRTKDQYVFIHKAILEFLICGDTRISLVDLRAVKHNHSEKDPTHQCTGYQHQFNVLDQVSPNPTEVNCSTALKHPDKNRGDKYLPAEAHRIVLTAEHPDYINAVFVDGCNQRNAYIIAQNPLKSTVRNFWKVITNRKCGVVVMLSLLEEDGEESCAQYWPSEGSSFDQFGEFSVNKLDEKDMNDFVVRKFIVESTKLIQAYQVTQFHVTNWSPDGTCSNLKVLIDVIEEVAKAQRRTGNNPILVHCSDTVSRSGMFCAIATTIDHCKTEGVVDVFQVVKALRIHKPGAVLNVEQYKLIHEAVLVYLESFDDYQNFKF